MLGAVRREMRLLPLQMKPQVAAPLLLGSAIWHLAALVVLVQTRVELSAVQRMAAGAHGCVVRRGDRESASQQTLSFAAAPSPSLAARVAPRCILYRIAVRKSINRVPR